jgi:hypothetical protein
MHGRAQIAHAMVDTNQISKAAVKAGWFFSAVIAAQKISDVTA